MDSNFLNPVRDFRDREEAQKESISNRVNKNRVNKDFLFLILLLVIVAGVFFWQNPEVTFDRIKAMIGPKLSLSEDSGLDLSEINIENLLGEEEEREEPVLAELSIDKEENGIGGPLIGELLEGEETLEKDVIVLEENLTLEEIQQEINRIAKEVERIDKEVQILVALSK